MWSVSLLNYNNISEFHYFELFTCFLADIYTLYLFIYLFWIEDLLFKFFNIYNGTFYIYIYKTKIMFSYRYKLPQ